MKRKKVDRQSLRTRQMLADSLMNLLFEKSYASITIQEILDRANVGRSTFYSHFYDKEDLLVSSLGHVFEVLNQQLISGIDEKSILPSLGLFQHVEQHYKLYKAFVRGNCVDLLLEKAKDFLYIMVEERFSSLDLDPHIPEIPISVLMTYVVNTLITLLKWWLDHEMPYSAKRMDDIFQRLVSPQLPPSYFG
ncbi:MAG: TetR/AcrR family transcriptional regulator [Bacillota bacterium]|nr:TetR/AcrR family transcriptional regulator [Bacillota bacterium]